MQLPEEFLATIPPRERAALAAALDQAPPVSVRLNPFKMEPTDQKQVPWCRWGRYLSERPMFALDPAWHAGDYYVQEASSMFVGWLAEKIGGKRLLDMCAAPGGKTTLLSTIAGLDGLVVANETIRARAQVLTDNVMRWGLGNVAVTSNDPSHFAAASGWFDTVLVDAPCSGEGMFRRHPEARAEWSPANVELCARRQRRILIDAWAALRAGGHLIYSTCTFNRRENEENVEWLAAEMGGEVVDFGGFEGVEHDGVGYRFWPHKVPGEGFFAAVVRKPDAKGKSAIAPQKAPLSDAPREVARELQRWVGQPEFMRFAQAGENFYGYYDAAFNDVKRLAGALTVIYSGVRMGQIFKGALRPDHALALFHDVADAAPRAVPADIVEYLRRGDVPPDGLVEGWNLICSPAGSAVGWAKRIGGRVNNMYPAALRVRN